MNFKFFLLLLITLLSIDNGTVVHSKEVVKGYSNTNDPAQKTYLQEEVLKQFGKLEGKAVSLEPLEVEKCFGKTYAEAHVRDFLDSLYRDEFPVSGMGLFLGVDKNSLAIQNKEYRYTFRPGKNEAEKEIFNNIFRFSKGLYSLIGFKGKNFVLNNETKKELKSVFDIPAIYIESAGNSIEEIKEFKPYETFYWNVIERNQKEKVKQVVEEIKQKLTTGFMESQDNKNLESSREVNSKIFGVVIHFSHERFDLAELGLKGSYWVNKFMYGYYSFQFRNEKFRNDQKLSKKHIINTSIDFQKTLLRQFFGGTKANSDLSGVSIDSIFKIKKANEDTVLDEPNAFEKSLFLSIYQRIKPLDMEKTAFINAVITVMQPCLSQPSNKI